MQARGEIPLRAVEAALQPALQNAQGLHEHLAGVGTAHAPPAAGSKGRAGSDPPSADHSGQCRQRPAGSTRSAGFSARSGAGVCASCGTAVGRAVGDGVPAASACAVFGGCVGAGDGETASPVSTSTGLTSFSAGASTTAPGGVPPPASTPRPRTPPPKRGPRGRSAPPDTRRRPVG